MGLRKINIKYLLVVAVLAVIFGGLSYWQYREMQKEKLTGEMNIPEKDATSQQIILSDEEIIEILREFAQKRTISFNDVGANEILLDTLEFKDANIKNRIQELIKKFEDLSEKIADAPDLRSWKIQRIKVCIAESIILNDLRNTIQRCGYEPNFSFTGTDDLLADAQVLPFFINGFTYYFENNYLKADYYFGQVKLHHVFLEDTEYVDFSASYLELYNKIYNKVLKISP